jgi:hypothetical protein
MRTPEREVIPDVLVPGDPCSGDEALYEPGSYANFLQFGGEGVDEATWAEAESAFHARVLAVLGGDAPWDDPALLRLAAILKVDHPTPHPDTRPPRIAEVPVPDELLSDVVEDLLPDYSVLAERVTGDDRRPDVAVVAVLFFVPVTDDGRRPFDRWAEDEPDRALVRSARVLAASPPGLYRDGVPLLPTAPVWTPTGPAPAGLYVARPYRVADGWAWSSRIPLPRQPDLAALTRRLRLELWRHRLRERRASLEDVLRVRPQVLYRAACEGAAGVFDAGEAAP